MGSFIKEMRKNHLLYLMLIPGAALLFVFSYMPMAGVLIAFKRLKFFGNIFESFIKSDWAGWQNFELLFNGPFAWQATRNTILYNLCFILLGMVAAITLAILLNELRNRSFAKVYQTIFLMPHFLSWVVVAYFLYSLLGMEKGIINAAILQPLKIPAVAWYYEPGYWPFILVLVQIWKTVGFNAIIYLASLSGISTEFYEAAQIDGATKWQQTKFITLPMLLPVVTILTLLALGQIFRADFGLFFNVTKDSASIRNATEVIDTYVYHMMRSGDFGLAAASGLYQAVVGCITIVAANRFVRRLEPDHSLF